MDYSLSRRLLTIAFFLLMTVLASAQETREPQPASPSSTFTIRSVKFEISGSTRERLLRDKVDIHIGTVFADRGSLDTYLAERRQRLGNERTLASVKVDYRLEQIAEGQYLVDIHFVVVDSWNLIALPYFRYDSNNGLLLSVRGRDYNFLGSMQALVLNLDYAYDEQLRQSFGGYSSFGLPFSLWGHNASIDASETLSIHADSRPVTSISQLGFRVTLGPPAFPLTFSISQGLQSNPNEVSNDPDPYFFNSSASCYAAIPTGLTIGPYGLLYYTPSLTPSLYWRPDALVRDDRKGFRLTAANVLSFGRIDWIENMRRGLSASFSSTDWYNFLTESFGVDLDWSVEAHASLKGLAGIDARLVGFHSFTDTIRTDLGTYMRGIQTTRLSGFSASFVNFNIPIKLFDFPTHVFITKNWFDFELQTIPFFDFAYVVKDGTHTVSDNLWYSAGIEFAVFPLRMRTFIVRASAGIDLESLMATGSFTAPSPRDAASPYELSFGLGLFF